MPIEIAQLDAEFAKLERVVKISSYEIMESFLQHLLYGSDGEKRVAIISLKSWDLKELMTKAGLEYLEGISNR